MAARQAEQTRAEASRIQETQGVLNSDTLRRLRRFGKVQGQSVPIVAAATAGADSSILSTPGSFSLGGLGGGGGGGGGGFGGGVSPQAY